MTFVCNKIVLWFLVLIYSVIGSMHSCDAASNLALGKPYTLSEQLNYPNSAPPADKTVLTDGIYSTGLLWMQRTTAGWQGKKNVEILIDLEKVSLINTITFNTGRNLSDVFFPAHVHAFAGPDKEHLSYVGDIVNSSENVSGPYQVKRFSLQNIGVKARFILLEAEAKGYYLFCDEIEVIEGDKENSKGGNLTLDTARKYLEQIRLLDRDKAILNKLAGALYPETAGRPDLASHLATIKQKISTLLSPDKVTPLETEILKLRGNELRINTPEKQLLIETIDPWQPITPVFSSTGLQASNIDLTVPKGGFDYAALAITNLASESRTVSISLDKNAPAGAELSLYFVPFIKSAAMEYVADPLLPTTGNTIIRPGESKIVLLMTRGVSAGSWQNTVNIASAQNVTSLNVKINVSKLTLPEHFILNSVNWGYLDSKPIADRKNEAIQDLVAHHTNVIVVPPQYQPLVNPANDPDFSSFETYLSMHRGASKVILFMAYSTTNRLTAGGTLQYMDTAWKNAFKKWYSGALRAAAKSGFKEGQIYLYPFDEMSTKEMKLFIPLATWAKSEIPGIKFYATLDKIESLEALPYLDIAQLHNSEDLLKKSPATNTELWIYDTKGPAKSLSPYSNYRLLAWKAFQSGYKGIGFWSYADASGSTWDDFDGNSFDYAVIYEGDGKTIISSRRWEAWRMGIEDYELLTLYSRSKGEVAAKSVTKYVLDRANDTARADKVRHMILEELNK